MLDIDDNLRTESFIKSSHVVCSQFAVHVGGYLLHVNSSKLIPPFDVNQGFRNFALRDTVSSPRAVSNRSTVCVYDHALSKNVVNNRLQD